MTEENPAGDHPGGDEHQRFARYLRELAEGAAEDETALVAAVLRDPDETMAVSAVVRHIDRRANGLLSGPRFEDWARGLAAVIGDREFPVRRLREWALLRAIVRGEPWTAEEVAAASDWFQREAAGTVTSPEALAHLARAGRTRRVRAAAAHRLRGHRGEVGRDVPRSGAPGRR
ncbi:hypothetical protein GCM10009730_03860 [Streptomyces albidochromogenes]|uniref:hypothetical protein n=1 Tax=Streptomyces albidochromogenes TaxID=329524 RepID=UPI00110FDBD9|nr:hypothetical protein [Streptomyces albidochromogenes]